MSNIEVREATADDAKSAIQLIKELAVYEKMPESCVLLTEEDWTKDGFGNDRFFYALLAIDQDSVNNDGSKGKLVGLALYFYTYSTWEGRSALLEDIFVKPEYRHKGVGHRFVTSVAKAVSAKGCIRLDLHVLDWNSPSLEFFKGHGAIDITVNEGWHFLRFHRDQLNQLASH